MTTDANEGLNDDLDGPCVEPTETLPIGCLIAGIPHLLGFTPEESLIVLAMSGREQAPVAATMRVDLPDPEDCADRDALIDWLAEPLAQVARASSSWVVALWSEALTPADEDYLRRATRAVVQATGLDALALVVWKDPHATALTRWRRVAQTGPAADLCSAVEPDGLPLTECDVQRAHAMFATAGRVPAPSREALEAEIQPVHGDDDRVASLTQVDDDAFEVAVTHAIGVLRAEVPAHDSHLMLLSSALSNIFVRDTVIHDLMTDPHRRWGVAADVLADAVRYVPRNARPPLATCLAIVRWQLGDGARALIAVTSALEVDPTYSLAHLVGGCITGGIHPEVWRRDLACLPRQVCTGRRG